MGDIWGSYSGVILVFSTLFWRIFVFLFSSLFLTSVFDQLMYVLGLDKVQNQSHSGMVNVYFSVWRMVFNFFGQYYIPQGGFYSYYYSDWF